MPDPVVLVPDELASRAAGDAVVLATDVRHHLRTVLRLADGAAVLATDGQGGTAPATLRRDGLVLAAAPSIEAPPRPRLRVLQGLGKGRKHDEVVRALTELGVDHVTAVVTQRSQVALEEARAERARQRWQAVARSAALQSRRAWHPVVDGPLALDAALDAAHPGRGETAVLVAHPGGDAPLAVLDSAAPRREIVLVVGPEGGFTDAEVAGLQGRGAQVVTLGRSILRTEHAALVLAAVVSASVGRMRE